MRHLRIKPTETDTIMHVYNRLSGSSGDFPFGNPLTSHHCIAFYIPEPYTKEEIKDHN
jgi:hypothetical protein